MKNRIWILAAAVTLAAAGCIASAAVAATFEEEAEIPEPQAGLSVESGYVLADHQGNIGLFEGDRLILEAEIPVSGLRQADQQLIAQGIRAETWEEAMRLLEDFGA